MAASASAMIAAAASIWNIIDGAREPRLIYFRRVVHDWINLSSKGMRENDMDDAASTFLNNDLGARISNFDLEASRLDEIVTDLGEIDVLPCDFPIVGVFILIDRTIVMMFQLAVENGVSLLLHNAKQSINWNSYKVSLRILHLEFQV